MVTSTSTLASILIDVMSLTVEALKLCKSMSLLWTLISKRSQVLVPSPQGDFLVTILKTFVGSLTGPLTLNCLFLASLTRSAQTLSKALWSLPERVILSFLIRASCGCSASVACFLTKLLIMLCECLLWLCFFVFFSFVSFRKSTQLTDFTMS